MHFFKEHFHQINIPPILPITSAFIIGIVWQAIDISITTTLLSALSFFIICLSYNKNKKYYGLQYYAAYCLIAAGGAYLYEKNIADYDSFYQFTHNCPVEITGTVIDKNKNSQGYTQSTVITLAIDSATNATSTKKYNKTIILHGSSNINPLCVGDKVTFFNIKCKKTNNESFNNYQIKEQIAATIFDQHLTYTIIRHPSWSLRRWIFDQKQIILTNLQQKLSPLCFIFFASLFLGNRTCVKKSIEKINEQFKRWGVYHLLSRSGMHLALFILSWQIALSMIPLPFIIKQLIMLILSFTYCMLSWTSAPFIRSLALFTLNRACLITKTPYHLLHYLTLTCLCFLLYCPLYLFFLDFQLSFGLTFALAWLNQLYGQHLYEEQQPKLLNY
jgi:predicted membrane metal-binding protein